MATQNAVNESPQPMAPTSADFMKRVREAHGKTQTQFAVMVGIGLRSVMRHEAQGTLPRSLASLRSLSSLAKQKRVPVPPELKAAIREAEKALK